MSRPKKLALLLAIFVAMTEARRENVIVLDSVLCIYYLVQFQKLVKECKMALIDFGTEFNAMSLTYAK